MTQLPSSARSHGPSTDTFVYRGEYHRCHWVFSQNQRYVTMNQRRLSQRHVSMIHRCEKHRHLTLFELTKCSKQLEVFPNFRQHSPQYPGKRNPCVCQIFWYMIFGAWIRRNLVQTIVCTLGMPRALLLLFQLINHV